MKPVVGVGRINFWPKEAVADLTEAGFEVRQADTVAMTSGVVSADQAAEAVAGVSALLTGMEWFSPEIFHALPDLRVLARIGVGFDHIDLAAATSAGVAVTITPEANHEGVAEHAFALILAVARQIITVDRALRQGKWHRPNDIAELRGRTLGIIGLGRIGRSLAIRAIAFGMRVLANEPDPNQQFLRDHRIELRTKNELMAESDYISLNCPLTSDTIHIIDAAALAHCRPNAILINTARGKLVDEHALAEALTNGRIAAAAVDCFEVEPVLPDNPLLRLDNVVLSPHLGGSDVLSRRRMSIDAAASIVSLLGGDWPEDVVVNVDLRERWRDLILSQKNQT